MKASRYIVGIDLGTTTTSLSYIDTLSEDKKPQSFPILQWESEDSLVEKNILPSFCYIASKKEAKNKRFLLPSYENTGSLLEKTEVVLGRYARKQQSKTPARVIHSAKSWLCHTAVNREGKVLPWASDEIIGDKRYSPVEVQSLLLLHLRLSWNHKMASHSEAYKLENQQVVITVPASFDEVATELTLRAAKLAGFKKESLSLIEEPQAAFYHWLEESSPEKDFPLGKSLKTLVCDVGGGTSDFSLFTVQRRKSEKEKSLQVERLKVSPHILLGGDNFDLKIASLYEEEYRKKTDKKLSSEEWAELVSHARSLKETLFREDHVGEELKVAITRSSKSRNLFGSALTLSLSKDYLKKSLLESFFPDDENSEKENLSALTDFGLPYAKNPSLTHHLKQFLGNTKIDTILFVGGSFIPKILGERLRKILETRQKSPLKALTNETLELGVSKGASLYGYSLKDPARLSITSGYPRSLYLEIQEKDSLERKLLCILPQGEKKKNLFHSFESLDLKMAVNQDISLSLYSSELRPEDKIESFTNFSRSEFKLLAPLQTRVETEKGKEKLLPILLKVGLTETGLLNIFCIPKEKDSHSESEKWEFTFEVRESKQEASEENSEDVFAVSALVHDPDKTKKAKEELLLFYGKGKAKNCQLEKPVASKILKDFEKLFASPRKDWPLQTLRELSSPLIEGKNSRGRSPAHEGAFFNLLGYFLRPGYGEFGDETRLKNLSHLFDEGPRHSDASQVQNEWWVFQRRVSGGLSKEKQERIFSKLLPKIRGRQATAEMIMTLGSLELVSTDKKALLAKNLVAELVTKGASLFIEQKFWALTRICSRVMLYSGSENILRPNLLLPLCEKLNTLPLEQKKKWRCLLSRFYQHSGRKVGDRELDLEEDLRALYLKEMSELKASEEEMTSLREVIKMKEEERKQLLGDSLPCGLLY